MYLDLRIFRYMYWEKNTVENYFVTDAHFTKFNGITLGI